MKIDSVSLPHLHLCSSLQYLVIFYFSDTDATERLHDDLDTQGLRKTYVHGKVHETTARGVSIDCNLPKPGDAKATASRHVGNHVKLY